MVLLLLSSIFTAGHWILCQRIRLQYSRTIWQIAHSTILIANNISNFHYLANHCCDFLYYQFHSVNLWLFTGEYADSWVTRSERFLDRQDAQAHILSLGPFLLGLNNFVSQPWIQALKEVKLLEGNRSVYRN